MHILVFTILLALFANAFLAIANVFFWQVKIFLFLHKESEREDADPAWKTMSKANRDADVFAHFYAGEIDPELRRQWGRANTYAFLSFLVMFMAVVLTSNLEPEYTKWPEGWVEVQ